MAYIDLVDCTYPLPALAASASSLFETISSYRSDAKQNYCVLDQEKEKITHILDHFTEAITSDSLHLQAAAIQELLEQSKELLLPEYFSALEDLLQTMLRQPVLSLNQVLLETAKENPELLIPMLEQALIQSNEELQRLALHMGIDLIAYYPYYFISLLAHGLYSDYAHIQWVTSLTLINNLHAYPKFVIPVLLDYLETYYSLIGDMIIYNEVSEATSIEDSIRDFEYALYTEEDSSQWRAIVKLIEFVDVYPDMMLTLFEKATLSNNSHVRWLAHLQLIKLARHYPAEVSDYVEQALLHEQEAASPTFLECLLNLCQNFSDFIAPLFAYIFSNCNLHLKLSALYQLVQIRKIHSDMFKSIVNRIISSPENSFTL